MIRLEQEKKKEAEDQRIIKGMAIERLKKNPDFQFFMAEVDSLRFITMQDFMQYGNSKGNGAYLRTRTKTLREVLELPKTLMFKAKKFLFKKSDLDLFLEELENRLELEEHLLNDYDGESEYGECLRARVHALDEIIGLLDEFILKMKIAIDEQNQG